MEAASYKAPHLRGDVEPPRLGALDRLSRGFADPVRGVLLEAGEMAAFTGRALVELRGVWRYTSEILRQAGILIVGSALVIWFMQFVMGTTCGTEGNYVLRGYGASTYSGVLTAYCTVREMGPYMWGYIVAAKVGCGLVAEIGSMRINEEIDAMESMGINSMRYIVATRLVAAWLAFPLIYMVGMVANTAGVFAVVVLQIHEVSQGGFETVHWAFQDPQDILFSLTKVMAMSTVIMLVGMYYGYRARGGPVGVGTATARSMILNLVLIHLIGSLGSMLFWGLNPKNPIGG